MNAKVNAKSNANANVNANAKAKAKANAKVNAKAYANAKANVNVNDIKELYLLKRKKRGLLTIVFSRTGIVLLLLLCAICVALLISAYLAGFVFQIMGGVGLFNLIVIICLINSNMDSSSKLTWVLVVSTTSIFGAIFYLYTKTDIGRKMISEGYNVITEDHKDDIQQNAETFEKLEKESEETAALVSYLNRNAAYPITEGNTVTYYPLGENKWADMLEELKKAEKFIFLEYFIVEEGRMWGSILNILKEKAEQGVEVRMLYDGTCAISLLPYGYPEMIENLGIKCKMFSPLRPFVSTHYNYRDHRKILVVDGKVGFTGGINLADEYINQKKKYGHWKDVAVRIEGEAVKNMTLMFLNMWSLGEENPNYRDYLDVPAKVDPAQRGYVVPYGDSPFMHDKVGEKVYMDTLNRANKYVHIMSPYLILDDTMLSALKYAAERGVDVKLILPGIPDKRAVYCLAKTYFSTLLDSGVKIYLYTPGFVHAKVFVSDDIKATVGTINLDYRSLYHHFECGAYMYKVDCIADIEKDYQDTLAKCSEVTYETIANEKLPVELLGKLTRLIAPLL